MDSNLVDIIRSIVEQINTVLTVQSIVVDRIYLCNTLHLTIDKIVTDSSGKEYIIIDFKINEYIVVEPFGHTDPFTGLTVTAPSLTFLHGDPKTTNNEYIQLDNRTPNKTPFIWLVESYNADNLRGDSAIELSFSARIFFLDWAEIPKWTSKEHNDNVIKPMQNLQKVFLQVIEDDYNFKRLENVSIDVRPKFGDTKENPTNLIIDEDLSGIDVSFKIDVYNVSDCCVSNDIADTCLPALANSRDTDGNLLHSDSVPSGGLNNQIISDGINNFNGGPVSGILAEGTKNITVQTDLGVLTGTPIIDTKDDLVIEVIGGGCIDATEIITDSDSNVLYTNTIASGGTNTQVIADATVTNSNGLFNDTILAEGNLVLNDINNIDTDGSIIATPAQTPFICSLGADGTVNVTNENGDVLHVVTVPSGGTVSQEVNDSNIANSDFSYGATLQAESNLILPDITHTDSDLTPVTLPAQTPMICTPAKSISSSIFNTGQETIYRTGDDGDRFQNGDYSSVNVADISDYYTLVDNNEWGHKKRFTGDTGGYMDEATGLFYDSSGVATTKALAFPNDILRDYCFRRRWYMKRSGSRVWNDCIDLAQTESKGGETGWFCPNRKEYESLVNYNESFYIDSRLFNWSTFIMYSSTTVGANPLQAWRYTASSNDWSLTNKTIVAANTYVKIF